MLDEPLGKIDSLTRFTTQTEFVDLWRRAGFSALLVTHDVEEALFMAQRVVVFTGSPARIRAVLVNNLPYPRQVEEVLYRHDGVLEACVVGLESDLWNESVHAVIVPRSGAHRVRDLPALGARAAVDEPTPAARSTSSMRFRKAITGRS